MPSFDFHFTTSVLPSGCLGMSAFALLPCTGAQRSADVTYASGALSHACALTPNIVRARFRLTLKTPAIGGPLLSVFGAPPPAVSEAEPSTGRALNSLTVPRVSV